jgi:hypothetical protein
VVTSRGLAGLTVDMVREYLSLGLRFGRLIDGYVDCWIGDPVLAGQVSDEPAPDPAALGLRAAQLRRMLPDSGLEAGRQRFLAAQLRALECAGRKLGGATVPFLAEVEEYFDVRVVPGEPDRYAALHDELAALVPGGGPLRERLVAFQDRQRLSGDVLGPAIRTVSDALRARLAGEYRLPPGEKVEYVLTADRPWNAFNEYLGGFRSRVTVNVDVGHRMTALPFVASHEAYPGHHSEHCLKEAGLVRAAGQDEHAITLVNTPQCLMAEGVAEMGLAAALGPRWGPWAEEVLRPLGLRFDGERSQRVEQAMGELLAVRQDAAILLHDRGASADEVVAFIQRWLLVTADRAGQMLRFLADPLWRAYTTTYIEGKRLVGRWLAGGPAGVPVAPRYRRLLAEPVLPAMLRAELAA